MAEAKVPLTITYHKHGTRPPIFVAGTFSDPKWEPQEMDYTTDEDGEYSFKKEVLAEPGAKIPYKFRVGMGDWWVVDEDAQCILDEAGNRNNLVETPSRQASLAPAGRVSGLSGGTFEDLNNIPVVGGTGDGGPSAVGSNTDALPVIKVEAQESDPAPAADPHKGHLDLSDPRSSGASTPSFVNVAAEVADSAQLLDKERPEPEISDEEAGKLGLRRLSTTPIPEVAETAAEVADIAQDLDADEDDLLLETGPPEVYGDFTSIRHDDEFGEHGHHQAPLFSHEAVGMYDPDESTGLKDGNDMEEEQLSSLDYDHGHIDPNDPTLEQFPSSRQGIMETVRQIETSLNEDQAPVEGVPPSPIVTPSRRGSGDAFGDYFVSSPIMASPIATRPPRRLGIPRSGKGSFSSDRSSALSLHSISEQEESESPMTKGGPAIILQTNLEEMELSASKSPVSDEDEGIVMKDSGSKTPNTPRVDQTGYLTPDRAASPQALSPTILPEPTPDISNPLPELDVEDSDVAAEVDEERPKTPITILPGNAQSESPSIVLHHPEPEIEDPIFSKYVEPVVETISDTGDSMRHIAGESTTKATSTAVEANQHSQAKNRAALTKEEGGYSQSTTAIRTRQKDDGFGGYIGRLWGERRKTLLTAGTAVVFAGFAWWKLRGMDRPLSNQ